MYTPTQITASDPIMVGVFSKNALGPLYHSMRVTAPSSSIYTNGSRMSYVPFYLSRGYSLARWYWQNGATVGTDYIQTGIYDENFNLFRASPRQLSGGTANQVVFQTPGIHGAAITSSSDSTDATTYTTASVTLKAGNLYLMAVENSKASAADAVSSIDSATGGYPTFTSRSSTTFNTSTANRVSIWSAVPTADFTGTLRINFSATQTGACWALNAFYHVDTATTDGIVQQNTGTGSSVTPLATLSAFGSSQNVGMGAFGVGAAVNGAVTGTTDLELSDVTAATPAQALQTVWSRNNTSNDETITSNQWGACAVEIKSLGTGAVYIPPMRGWLAFHCSGTTATFFQRAAASTNFQSNLFQQSSQFAGLPAVGTPTSSSTVITLINHGFTRSTSP